MREWLQYNSKSLLNVTVKTACQCKSFVKQIDAEIFLNIEVFRFSHEQQSRFYWLGLQLAFLLSRPFYSITSIFFWFLQFLPYNVQTRILVCARMRRRMTDRLSCWVHVTTTTPMPATPHFDLSISFASVMYISFGLHIYIYTCFRWFVYALHSRLSNLSNQTWNTLDYVSSDHVNCVIV